MLNKTRLTEEEARFIEAHIGEDETKLLFKLSKMPVGEIDTAFCCSQIALRKRLKAKLPTFVTCRNALFAPSLNLEQSSSEQTADYKSRLIGKGERVCDLTSGFGVDAFFFAQKAGSVLCVERQEWLSEICRNNFEAMRVENCDFISSDCESVLESGETFDTIYIDPSRRDENLSRVYSVEDCTPDVVKLQKELLKAAPHVIIKLSPMADLKSVERSLDYISDLHVVSVQNECKEVLVELRRDHKGKITYHAVNLTKQGEEITVFVGRDHAVGLCSENLTSQVGRYIYEPNTSLLKIGCFAPLIERYGFKKLAINSHIFTSDTLIEDFQGRTFEVLSLRSASPKALKDIGKANIVIRNFPQSVQDIRKATKIKEGGEEFLFFTTLSTEEKICIQCKRV